MKTRTLEFHHENEIWELNINYWRGTPPTYWDPGDSDDFEIEEAINLNTGKQLSEEEFYQLIGKNGKEQIEFIMMNAVQDDYDSYCDMKYDEWKDSQIS